MSWFPEDDREMLDAKSPIYFADRVARPLLIAAAANDVRVPISQNDRFVEAARAAGAQVEYLARATASESGSTGSPPPGPAWISWSDS